MLLPKQNLMGKWQGGKKLIDSAFHPSVLPLEVGGEVLTATLRCWNQPWSPRIETNIVIDEADRK